MTATSAYTSPLPPPVFPSKLTSALPAEEISNPALEVPDDVLRTPRIVRDAVYSYVHPEDQSRNAALLSWNPAMASFLGSSKPDRSKWSSDDETHVLKLMTGATKDRHLIDTIFPTAVNNEHGGGLHPWAHCYGGHQFGFYAGQLGDGRAITLYEALSPETGETWELQLKGAGKTAYSRFADGYAVLRSSIREYLGAEAVAALGIASSRSLSIASTETMVMREEGPEPGAIVCRLAPSWIRFGSFEIFHYRKDFKNLRRLAEYVAKELYGFEDAFETKAKGEENKGKEKKEDGNVIDGQPKKPFIYNRFARMFEEVSRRTARMVSGWQAAGFCHGVMNTDNMSILGLTIDYGPFAFLDRYDPTWICNHSDDQGRYMYQAQPGICLWNLTKLALTLEHLIGAEDRVDDQAWMAEQQGTKELDEALRAKGSELVVEILQKGFREEFLRDYRLRMNHKMGLVDQVHDSDLEDIVVPALAWMDEFEVDYHGFYRQLAQYSTQVNRATVATRDANLVNVRRFVERTLDPLVWKVRGDEAVAQTEGWLGKYHARILASPAEAVRNDRERRRAMNKVNPAFVLRNWIAQKVIERVTAVVEKDLKERIGGGGSSSQAAVRDQSIDAVAVEVDRNLLDRVLDMCQNPFGDEAEGDDDEEEEVVDGQTCKIVKNNAGLERYSEFVGPVPEWGQGIQCSCSS